MSLFDRLRVTITPRLNPSFDFNTGKTYNYRSYEFQRN
jgi:hypothetical protein